MGYTDGLYSGFVDATVHFHFSVRCPTLCNQPWSEGFWLCTL